MFVNLLRLCRIVNGPMLRLIGAIPVGSNKPMVVTLSGAKSLGVIGGMLRFAQPDKLLKFFRSSVLGAILVILSIVTAPLFAQGNTAVVRPEPSELAIGEGQVETLSIVLENAQDVYGIDVRARFDPAVIEIVDADPDSAGIQMIPGSFPQPDFLVRNTADNQAGTLQYVTTQVNPTLPVKGSGLVFSIQVRGKALGQSAVVSIEFVEIADRRGNTLPVDSLNSTVTVVSPKPPTVTPTAPPMSTVTVIDPTRASTPVTSATRVSPTRTTPATASGNRADQLPSDSVLIWVALAGFVGAGVLLAVAATVLLRRRHRTP